VVLGNILADEILGTDTVHRRHDPHFFRPLKVGKDRQQIGQSPGLGADEDDREVLYFGQFGEAREAAFRFLFELHKPANQETVAVHLLRTGLRELDAIHLHAAAYQVRPENRAHRTETDDADLVSFQGYHPLLTAQSTAACCGIIAGGILSPAPAISAP
jgi:hypothetical protein